MQKRLTILLVFLICINSVYAFQAVYSGIVNGVQDGELVVARADNKNYFAEINDGRFAELSVEGGGGSEVEFFLQNKVVERIPLAQGVQTISLDVDVVLPPKVVELPKVDEPQQIAAKPSVPVRPVIKKPKKAVWPYFVLIFVVLALAVGVFVYLKQHQVKFEGPKIEKPAGILKPLQGETPSKPLPEFLKKMPRLKSAPQITEFKPLRPLPQKGPQIKVPFKLPKIDLEKPPEIKPIPKEPAPLKPQENKLKEYVSTMREKGFSDAQIKAALYARGWKKEVIEGLF